MVKRVIANVMDYDMHNLFYPRPLLDEMEDAYEGAYDVQPRLTLRERQYENQPLLIRPDYKGNFLEKLEDNPLEGKLIEVEASSSENLLDFDMPSEMLKHQEKPHPRVILDDFYDFNRPGDQAGYEDLKDYWKRDWMNEDSPEISEDKWLRMWSIPGEHNYHQARKIMASYIDPFNEQAIRVVLGFTLGSVQKIKTAKKLGDLLTSKIHGKKNVRDNAGNVTVVTMKSSTEAGRWVFHTGSPGSPVSIHGKTFEKPYTTVIEVIPNGNIRNPLLLHGNVSCTCPSWLYWGAQYNAVMGGYIYGKVVPVFAPPRRRDPERSFIACKHIIKCIDFMAKSGVFKIEKMPAEKRKRMKEIREPRKIKFDTSGTGEVIKVPKDLIRIGQRPKMKQIMEIWEKEPKKRENLMNSLTDENEITFMAFRYPESASILAAERLRKLPQTKEVKEGLKKVESLTGEKEYEKGPAMPIELKKFDEKHPKEIEDLDKKMDFQKDRIIKDISDPDLLAYIAFKYHLDDKILSEVEYNLRKKYLSSTDVEEKNKSDYWLRTILGGPAL